MTRRRWTKVADGLPPTDGVHASAWVLVKTTDSRKLEKARLTWGGDEHKFADAEGHEIPRVTHWATLQEDA